MSRFASRQRTFFFEEPVLESGLSKAWLETQSGDRQLVICTPHLPSDISIEDALALQRQLLDQVIEQRHIRPDILWFYTPMALRFAHHLSAPVVVYDCMDELSAFMGAPAELCQLESELMRRAHLVFTGGASLYESKRHRHPNVHAFPSSVDAQHFSQARNTQKDPADQASLSRPRLGFFGVIDERLDLELIAQIADTRPNWQLVMLGPIVKIAPASVPRRPNIHWLGQKDYQELPSYLAGWDVALMPFALNASTRFISPTKTLEYLAAGKPVVSTAIADVVSPYGESGVVDVADRNNFVKAIEHALEPRSQEKQRAADARVARTSWDQTWQKMHELIRRSIELTPQPERNSKYV